MGCKPARAPPCRTGSLILRYAGLVGSSRTSLVRGLKSLGFEVPVNLDILKKNKNNNINNFIIDIIILLLMVMKIIEKEDIGT